jgi:ElaB/YqjD/DUF883 family membrane-anchored ribosome-binding protein
MDQDPHQDVGAPPRPAHETARDDSASAGMQVEALRSDMEETRAHIGETLEQLEDRLTPGNLAGNAATAVKDAASRRMEQMMHTAGDRMNEMTERTREAAGAIAERAGSNPWPAVLVGAGLGYLLYHALSENEHRWDSSWNARGYSRDYPEGRAVAYTPESGNYETAGSRQGDGQTVRHIANRGGRQLARVGRRASTFASRGARMVRANPIGFGIAALAAGAAVGLSAPETETENQWMGDTRDALIDRAKEMAGVQGEPSTGAQPGSAGRA